MFISMLNVYLKCVALNVTSVKKSIVVGLGIVLNT